MCVKVSTPQGDPELAGVIWWYLESIALLVVICILIVLRKSYVSDMCVKIQFVRGLLLLRTCRCVSGYGCIWYVYGYVLMSVSF